MRFKKLTLNNIGAYYSNHTFNFSVNGSQKIILIGGKNGTGKTTILDMIRLSLYGPLAYGFKTENDGYQQRIYSLLNKKAIETHESLFQLFLEFDFVEDYQRSTYIFKRQWNLNDKKIRENFSIFKEGKHIADPQETDIIQTKINEIFPPQLFRMCLFDGEAISEIITKNLISSYLRDTANVVFNLDLFINLNKDLESHKKQLLNRKNPEVQNELEMITEELEIQGSQKGKILDSIVELNQKIAVKHHETDELKKQFNIYGGLKQEERDNVIAKINKLEQERSRITNKIKTFIVEALPLFLVKKELNDIKMQMELEQQYETYSYLESNISAEHISEILSNLELVSDSSNSISSSFLNDILNLVKPDIKDPIHRASFTQRSEIQNVLTNTNKFDLNDVSGWFSKSSRLLSQMQKLRKKVEVHDSNAEFQNMTEQIQILAKEIHEANDDLSKMETELKLIEEEKAIKEKKLTQLQQSLSSFEKAETTIQNINNIVEVNNEFIKIQLEDKLHQVQEEVVLMLNQLMRKGNFIKKVVICHKNFDVILFSNTDYEIDIKVLSAGEKQILLLSLVWAIVKVSERKIPFVFDTLLGRLDTDHKHNILTKYIPYCGEQIIILSTDSEVDRYHLDLIKPYLASTVTLVIDTNIQTSRLEVNNYFDSFQLEGEKHEIST